MGQFGFISRYYLAFNNIVTLFNSLALLNWLRIFSRSLMSLLVNALRNLLPNNLPRYVTCSGLVRFQKSKKVLHRMSLLFFSVSLKPLFQHHLSQRTAKPAMTCVTSKDSHQPVHPLSMAKFLVYITKTRLENFTTKKKKKKKSNIFFYIFSYFCSKHRLWVLVRTASTRRF